MFAPFIKIVTNIVVAFVAGFGAALATGVGAKAALAAGIGAVVAILAGLFQKAPGA